jgi:phosphoglycerate kinase
MSSGLIEKKSIEDIWPINKKRFLIRVDFNVTVKNMATVAGADYRLRQALPTIRHVIEKGGMAILLSHMGRPKGIDMRKVNAKSREAIFATWEAERGTGMTNYFASLTGPEKVQVLKSAGKPPAKLEPTRGSGKTVFFAALPFEEKRKLLDAFTHVTNRTADTQCYDVEATLKPVAAHLQSLLGGKVPVHFAPDPLSANDIVRKMKPGEVCVLENLRFYTNETSSSEEERTVMARLLAVNGDFYVLDAFGTMHRTAASLTELPRVMQHGASGYLVEAELKKIQPALSLPSKPMALVLGGNKVKECLSSLEQVLHRLDKLILIGAVALVFLRAQGRRIGKSLCDDSNLTQARNILERAQQLKVQVVLPLDHVTTATPIVSGTTTPNLTPDADVPEDHAAVDIGPQSIAFITREIRACRTVVWVGVAGIVEVEPFHEGTVAIAKALAQPNIYSIAGGRLTTSVIQTSGYLGAITHLSTGGAAVVQLLSERALPALRGLSDRGRIEGGVSGYAVSVMDHFRMLRLFSSCSEKVLGMLIKKVVRKCYAAGDCIIHEGDRHSGMWVIAQGTVQLENQKKVVLVAEQGDSIGMMHFLNNERAEYTVTATTAVTTYVLTSATFEELCQTVPNFSLEVTQNMCRSTQQTVTAPRDSLWSRIANNFDRTPYPVAAISNSDERRDVAAKTAQWASHIIADVISKATVAPQTPQDIALSALSITGLHTLYHIILKQLRRPLGISQFSNPFLRILVAQDTVAFASYCVSFASPELAASWVRSSLAALCAQVVQGVLSGSRRTPNAFVGLLSSVIVALAFSRSLKLAQKTAQEALVYALAFLLVYRPFVAVMDALTNATGCKRPEITRKDF